MALVYLIPLLFLLHPLSPFPTVSAVGINYGTLGNNLPSPKTVAQLLQSTIIDKVKIYDTNPQILQAFSNSGIDIIVAVENNHVANISSTKSAAEDWFSARIAPFIPATSIVGIAVASILTFLADTGSPFMVNAYPYFAYRDNPTTVSLEYALLGNSSGVHDPKGYVYTNMLDAQIDAIRSAIASLGFGGRSIHIIVSESGWPSKGEPGETSASPDNAKTYNTRLITKAQSNKGTPMKPNDKIDIFLFALFNENKKEGGASERNFGLFNGDGSKVYDVDLSCEFCSGSKMEFGFGPGSKVVQRGPSVWCVAKPHADEKLVQGVLDFCCGPGGVDCREVYENGACFGPNKVHAHASYAMNAYYQMHGRNYWNCDFKGSGLVTFSDPSYGSCKYSQQ
ncbi:putative glucan endo-1,3-beta-D-glucosidase [Helianthus annuus]|nr:putative glucan endo-1,3-beta-D-glucosidase [Helianthus annuus]